MKKALIYFLQNPITNEIFYVGCTKRSLSRRLDGHYHHLQEVKQGKRKTNKRFEYLESIQPAIAKIILIDTVEACDVSIFEKMYIGLFSSWGFNLTNMTDGGDGGNTGKYLSEIEKKKTGLRISRALKGKKKPEGFAENMSKTRIGTENPMGGKTKYPLIVQLTLDGIFINSFKNGIEINEAVKSKFAHGNVIKACKNKTYRPYGFQWLFLPDCSEEIQNFLKKIKL